MSRINNEIEDLKKLLRTITVKIFDGQNYPSKEEFESDLAIFENEMLNGISMTMALSLPDDKVEDEVDELADFMSKNIHSIRAGLEEFRKVQQEVLTSELN